MGSQQKRARKQRDLIVRFEREKRVVEAIEQSIAANRPIDAINLMRECWPEYNMKEAHDYVFSFPIWKNIWKKCWPEFTT